eukprot:249081-Pyramimonas_sp.AAC.1
MSWSSVGKVPPKIEMRNLHTSAATVHWRSNPTAHVGRVSKLLPAPCSWAPNGPNGPEPRSLLPPFTLP